MVVPDAIVVLPRETKLNTLAHCDPSWPAALRSPSPASSSLTPLAGRVRLPMRVKT